MRQDNHANTVKSLDEVARKIEENAEKSDEHVITAAKLMLEARRRVIKGEAGDTTWPKWAPDNIKLSFSRLRELESIARADDPREEIERLRELTLARVKKHRAKKAAEKTGAEKSSLESERKDLIAWAKTAPIEEVQRVLEQVASNDNVAGSSEKTPATESQHAA